MTDPVNDGVATPTTVPITVKGLADAGLEPQLRSWISSGPNELVTAEQITRAIGEDRLAQAAESLGREPGDLAADLPGLIDTASPNGHVELAPRPGRSRRHPGPNGRQHPRLHRRRTRRPLQRFRRHRTDHQVPRRGAGGTPSRGRGRRDLHSRNPSRHDRDLRRCAPRAVAQDRKPASS
ncbi:YidB family protein [Streptomyces xanthophaeus]|uniref:YidB family protein n=1 Tax=Streptomyces xanthophaeus TaxID=67385 RepID=UPI0038675B17